MTEKYDSVKLEGEIKATGNIFCVMFKLGLMTEFNCEKDPEKTEREQTTGCG